MGEVTEVTESTETFHFYSIPFWTAHFWVSEKNSAMLPVGVLVTLMLQTTKSSLTKFINLLTLSYVC